MPVVSCPKCPTKLSVPEGATGNVKCPKCSTIFPVVAPKPSAAFEVVEDEPPPSPPPPKAAARPKAAAPMPLPPPPPANKPFTLDEDEPKKKKPAKEEDDDRPRSKRRRDEDDEEDDEDERPRKKKRRDDDDDEDNRPRSKRRRDDDEDDDDEDDRPRKRKHRDDDDDDEDDWHRAPKRKKGAPGFASAKAGVLLLNISLWLYAASLALISFFIFLGMVGAFDASSSTTTTTRRTSSSQRGGFSQNDELSTTSSSQSTAELVVKLPGILGIGNWVVAAIGFGFCIAGPKQARGMAITAASLAGAHLVLAGISINNVGGMMGGYGGGASAGTWILWATTLPILDSFLPVLFYGGASHIGSDYIFALLGAGCECARLIFAMLMVKSLAIAAKDYEAEEKAQLGVMSAGGVTGATVIFAAGLSLLPKMVTITSFNFYFGSILLVYLAFTGMLAMPILATNMTRKALGRKAR